MSDNFDPARAVYTPPQVAAYGVQAIEQIRANADYAIPLPIAEIKDYFSPLLPGQMCTILAQTHNYKSGFLHFWEHETARMLTEKKDPRAIIHVSVEEGIEEQAFLEFSRASQESPGRLARGEVQDWDLLLSQSLQVGTVPIYRIGDSLARAEDAPNLYMSNMIRAIRTLTEGRVTGTPVVPALLCFDYLQAFPIDPEVKGERVAEQRRLQVRQDVYRLRQAANFFRCPVVVAVQAKQNLSKEQNSPIFLPGMYDGEESSSIAQRTDRMLSLWMPKNNHAPGTLVEHKNFSFRVTEKQLWIKVVKQRGNLPSGRAWPCVIDFKTNFIAPEFVQTSTVANYPNGHAQRVTAPATLDELFED